MKKGSLSAAANVALIVAAAAVVWNTMRSQPAPAARPEPAVPENWEKELATGIQIGAAGAPIEIIELMDFQCPFCRAWFARLDSLRAELPQAVLVSFHHWPLANHPHALGAAIAAECAHRQRVFAAFAHAVFEGQALLGSQPWSTYASAAGVPDLAAFDACTVLPADSFPRIQHGIDLARQVGARGTPTTWVNGQMRRPTLDQLRKLAIEAKGR